MRTKINTRRSTVEQAGTDSKPKTIGPLFYVLNALSTSDYPSALRLHAICIAKHLDYKTDIGWTALSVSSRESGLSLATVKRYDKLVTQGGEIKLKGRRGQPGRVIVVQPLFDKQVRRDRSYYTLLRPKVEGSGNVISISAGSPRPRPL